MLRCLGEVGCSDEICDGLGIENRFLSYSVTHWFSGCVVVIQLASSPARGFRTMPRDFGYHVLSLATLILFYDNHV